jgi:hypothetical protein
MAFEEFQSFQTKPRRGRAGVIAAFALVGLGVGALAYWYGRPAGLKPLATAEIAPNEASATDQAPASPKSKAGQAMPGAAAPAGQTAAVHSGKAGRSQTSRAADTSSQSPAEPVTGQAQAMEGHPLPAYAPAASTVELARVPADPRQYDKTNAEVTAPVLLTPLSHVPLPPEIRREASSTDVAIQVTINEEGTVDIVKASVSPRTLGESILVYNGLSIAKTWRFHPASRNGLPVKYRLLVPLSMF